MGHSHTQDWIEGDKGDDMPGFLNGRQAVVWARDYSAENEERCDCVMLQTALSMVPGAKRMVRLNPLQCCALYPLP